MPPFMTSTLQQEASRKLGFAPAHTMRIAQRLYEGIDIGGETVGLITYMRTDGVDIARGGDHRRPRASSRPTTAREYVPASPRTIPDQGEERAGGPRGDPPDRPRLPPAESRSLLEPDQAKLYELIWLRTIASQMESAELERTTVDITAKVGGRTLDLRATGTVVKFDGFLTLYTEDQDDKADDEDANRLPQMATGERAAASARSPPPSISPSRRRATPKPRWSSAWKSSASAGPRPTPRSCRC